MGKTYKSIYENYRCKNKTSRLKDRKQKKYSYKNKDVKNGSSYKKYWFWSWDMKRDGKGNNIILINKLKKKFNYIKKGLLDFENRGKSRKEYDL